MLKNETRPKKLQKRYRQGKQKMAADTNAKNRWPAKTKVKNAVSGKLLRLLCYLFVSHFSDTFVLPSTSTLFKSLHKIPATRVHKSKLLPSPVTSAEVYCHSTTPETNGNCESSLTTP